MPNENDNLDQSQTAPTSIEEAMLAMRKNNQQASADDVGSGNDSAGSNAEAGESTEENASNDTNSGSSENQQQEVLDNGDNGSTGGHSTGVQEDTGNTVNFTEDTPGNYDYDEIGKSYIQSIQQAAIQAANNDFRNSDVKKVSINDLYEKDENGRVSFNNPDNPGQYFSSRAEAQQWVDAINSQIDNEWRNTVRRYQNQYVREIQPTMRLLEFGPQFDAMTKQQQDIFDEIIDPYAITDNAGNTIGYSCDLNEAKRIAVNIAAKTATGEQPQNENNDVNTPVQGTGPAVDATTSGSDNSQNQEPKNPKDIQEAMKLVIEQEKKNRKK